MKFKDFLKEQSGTFKYSVKYPQRDFDKFVSFVKDLYEYDAQGDMTLVYFNGKHVATYNTKTNVLDTDKTEVFGK